MKNLLKLTTAILLAFNFGVSTVKAQSPQKMTYQAVIRNTSNQLIVSTQIGIEIIIYQGFTTGTQVYSETQTPTTNTNGLLSIEIGGEIGFDTINWANGPYFIETNIDVDNSGTYTITGVSQLLTVPYALHAKTAESITGEINERDPNFTAWDKSTGISITEEQISDLAHTVDTDTHVDSTEITELGFVAGAHTVDTDTHLSETEVDNMVADNGYLTTENDPDFTAWDKSTGISITEEQISDLAHTVDTDTHIDSTEITELGFVTGAHTVDTDTHLSETDVDNMVADNGYLTEEVDGSITNEIQTIRASSTGDTLSLSNGGYVIVPNLSDANYITPQQIVPRIQQVTIDEIENKYKITFGISIGVSAINIYKKLGDEIILIGNVSGEYTFLDLGSAPYSCSQRYYISYIYDNGQESELSAYHQPLSFGIGKFHSTISLFIDPYINKGNNNFVKQNYIYRGTTPDNLQLIDSIPAFIKVYNDVNVSQDYYYDVIPDFQ